MKNFFKLLPTLLIILPLTLFSSTPKIIVLQTQSDFEKGKPKGVSISSRGLIALAPEIKDVANPDVPFVWSTVIDSDGDIYTGGGNSGRIMKIDRSGAVSVLATLDEVQVYGLARVDEFLYVASSPNGAVYRFDTDKTDQKPDEDLFFDPEDMYIWSLASNGGNLFVATGEKGRVYQLDSDGQSSVFYQSEDEHIRQIRFDRTGNLIVGTANKGLILRIAPSGDAFVLYDSPLVEITDLLIDEQGNIFASASGESRLLRGRSATQQAQMIRTDNGDERDEADLLDATSQQIAIPGAGRGQSKSAIYKISNDGIVTNLWHRMNEQVYSMISGERNDIIIGTGDSGRIYSIDKNEEYSLLTELDEMQVTALSRSAGEIVVGTSNSGSVYRLQNRYSREGEYLSEAFDATLNSRWGTLSWEADVPAGTSLSLMTRSGNTEEPDQSWSDWSDAYYNASGELITSPQARFLQVKIKLTSSGDKTPELKKLSFSYLQRNIPPRVESITIHPSGDLYPEFVKYLKENISISDEESQGSNGYSSSSMGRKVKRKGFQSVSWSVKDENSDNLQYSLYFRGQNEKNWRPLVSEFYGIVYSWDTELLPDGHYYLRVVASDSPSNPETQAEMTEKMSDILVIDNTGPVVSNLKQNGKTLSFTVSDEYSMIENVEYGVNAGEWKVVYPVDGICDSKKETFKISINTLLKGANTIVVKTKDMRGNIGFGKQKLQSD